MSEGVFTGGCQCGAVRFRATGYVDAAVCHCRMCQKQFGALYAPLATFEHVEWTRGEPKHFRSSNIAARGFCGDCGTPLSYEPDSGRTSLAIGALDTPSRVRPSLQYGIEARIPWVGEIQALRAVATEETGVTSLQHPDHET
ncbi:MAG: GFA family protein [Caulobacteraceae bacterium]|jgi:hypothetical protein